MGLISLVVVLLVLALLIYGIQRYAPGDPTLKNAACFVVVIVAAVAILAAFGLLPAGALR